VFVYIGVEINVWNFNIISVKHLKLFVRFQVLTAASLKVTEGCHLHLKFLLLDVGYAELRWVPYLLLQKQFKNINIIKHVHLQYLKFFCLLLVFIIIHVCVISLSMYIYSLVSLV
jgi:hypothetical protein